MAGDGRLFVFQDGLAGGPPPFRQLIEIRTGQTVAAVLTAEGGRRVNFIRFTEVRGGGGSGGVGGLLSSGQGQVRLSLFTSTAAVGPVANASEVRVFEEVGQGLTSQAPATMTPDAWRNINQPPIDEATVLPFTGGYAGSLTAYLATLNNLGGVAPALFDIQQATWNGLTWYAVLASTV